jgi:pyruvate/2-oxoacid:ferredoxin oxidoreductase alpha subunit
MGKGSGEIDNILQLAGGILVGGLALYRLGTGSEKSSKNVKTEVKNEKVQSVPQRNLAVDDDNVPSWSSRMQPNTSMEEFEPITQDWKTKKVDHQSHSEEVESEHSTTSESDSEDDFVPSWMSSKDPQLSVHEIAVPVTSSKKATNHVGHRDLQCASKTVSTISTSMSDILFVYPCGANQFVGDALNIEESFNAEGYKVKIQHMESRAGAGAAVVGALSGGAKATILTGSANLKTMIPNLFEMTNERLPAVIHVVVQGVDKEFALRQDFSDVMAVRDTGAIMISSSNAQEVHDMSILAHVVSQETSLPTIHFFDGVRGISQLSKVKTVSTDLITGFASKRTSKSKDSWSSVAMAADFGSESSGSLIARNINQALGDLNAVLGTEYNIFDYVGSPLADSVIVAMGAAADVIANEIIESGSSRVGLIKVRLLRPWSAVHFLAALPKSVRRVSILDQSGTRLAPLFQEVVASFHSDSNRFIPKIVSTKVDPSSSGLSPADALTLISNVSSERPQTNFFVGKANHQLVKPVTFKQVIAFGDSESKHFLDESSKGLSNQFSSGAKVNTQRMLSEDAYNNLVRVELRLAPDHVPLPESYQVIEGDCAVVFGSALVNATGSVAHQIKEHGTLIVASNDEIPESVRAQLEHKAIKLIQIDSKQIIEEILGEELSKNENLVRSGEMWLGFAAALFVAKGEAAFSQVLGHIKSAVKENLIKSGANHTVMNAVLHAVSSIGSKLHSVHAPTSIPNFGTPLSYYKKAPGKVYDSVEFDFDTRSFASAQDIGSPVPGHRNNYEVSTEPTLFVARASINTSSNKNCKNLAIIGRKANNKESGNEQVINLPMHQVAFPLIFPGAYDQSKEVRPSAHGVHLVRLTKRTRLTPQEYNRNIFHLEFDISGSSLKYEIGDALGVYGHNDEAEVDAFIKE